MRRFAKYEGTGNDFIIIDDPQRTFPREQEVIARLCHRRLGIGADGLILIQPSRSADYTMVYFNADGRIGSMCGNGARCTFDYVRQKTMRDDMTFEAYDGRHRGQVLANGWVSVSMGDVSAPGPADGDCVLDTGSPHYIRFVEDLDAVDVYEEGKTIRMQESYRKEGINVNFVEQRHGQLHMATFERGVEDVTLSCGTGAVAVALTHAMRCGMSQGPVDIQTPGGPLRVDFNRKGPTFRDILLQGPVRSVFEGMVGVKSEE